MKSKLLAVLVLCFSSGITYATFEGNELLSNCRIGINLTKDSVLMDYLQADRCLSLVRGIRDINVFYESHLQGEKLLFCQPKTATNEQLVRVVIKFMEDNPALLHLRDSMIVVGAFQEAFPCE